MVIDVLGQEVSVGDYVAFTDDSRVFVVGKVTKIVNATNFTISCADRTFRRGYYETIKVTNDMIKRPSIRKEIGLE